MNEAENFCFVKHRLEIIVLWEYDLLLCICGSDLTPVTTIVHDSIFLFSAIRLVVGSLIVWFRFLLNDRTRESVTFITERLST